MKFISPNSIKVLSFLSRAIVKFFVLSVVGDCSKQCVCKNVVVFVCGRYILYKYLSKYTSFVSYLIFVFVF